MKSILLALACFRNTPQIELEFGPMSSISLPQSHLKIGFNWKKPYHLRTRRQRWKWRLYCTYSESLSSFLIRILILLIILVLILIVLIKMVIIWLVADKKAVTEVDGSPPSSPASQPAAFHRAFNRSELSSYCHHDHHDSHGDDHLKLPSSLFAAESSSVTGESAGDGGFFSS